MTLSAKQKDLISDLNLIIDPHERLSALVNKSTNRCFPAELKTNDHLVSGCVSRVWVAGSLNNGLCSFRCDAESPMVKGLVALLCDLYSGGTPDEVMHVEPEIWAGCGLDRLLSPTRMNGLRSVRARIRDLAARMAPPSQINE